MKHSYTYRKLVERGEPLDVFDKMADKLGIDMDDIKKELKNCWPDLRNESTAELIAFLFGVVAVQSERIASLELWEELCNEQI